MRKGKTFYFPLIVIAGILSLVFSGPAFCRPNVPQAGHQSLIEGEDHQALKDFFARYEQDKANRSLSDRVRRILLRALPETYRSHCSETAAQCGRSDGRAAGISTRLLYVEKIKDERPIRCLIAYACFSKEKESNQFRDERLAALVIDRTTSRLTIMPDNQDDEAPAGLSRIQMEKTVRIGGKGVIGLSFQRSNENPCADAPERVLKEDRVYFYVINDNEVKPAGSALKRHEEYAVIDGKVVEKTVYNAGIVFKKDMKGNIIGILAPYTVKKDDIQTGKGLTRYNWSREREEFIRE
ncbi:MAG: hypothetical protein A4E57_01887 [Syntrophorhabdaceae bacterium PtaU1.Bin034]|nr:MAG: hypothetical protein A4E57_01887 [Syntrophorhabdaceae bacterium PtaU1.Bin034]